MTNQEVLDRVWDVFVTNKAKKCVNSYGKCSYGPPGTTGCAIGCCLPDNLRQEVYDFEMAHTLSSVSTLMKAIPAVSCLFADCSPAFLIELQSWHDTSGTILDLKQTAERYNLKTPKV